MNYQDKTREELILELQALQKQNISLKSSFEKDIIAHKVVEKKLEENLDLFSNLACLVPGVIYQYRLFPDGHSSFPYSSPGINEIYEVTPEEAGQRLDKVLAVRASAAGVALSRTRLRSHSFKTSSPPTFSMTSVLS